LSLPFFNSIINKNYSLLKRKKKKKKNDINKRRKNIRIEKERMRRGKKTLLTKKPKGHK